MIGRRPLLLGAAASGAGAALPAVWARASAAVAAPERWIWARNHAREEVATAYRSGDAYHPQAIARLRHLFRVSIRPRPRVAEHGRIAAFTASDRG